MKSLAELQALRDEMKQKIGVRSEESGNTRIVVGMATCGSAAGARPVLNTLMDEVAQRKLNHVTVAQTGCIGICRLEPVVEVYEPGKEKTTYVKMNPEKMRRVVEEHILNGHVVKDYVIGSEERN